MSPVESMKSIWKSIPSRERSALVASVSVLIIAVALAAILKRIGIGESAAIIAIMIVPLIIYGVATGKIQEFTAPGGWGAKFREVASNTVQHIPISKFVDELNVVPKGGRTELRKRISNLSPGDPVAMTLELGRKRFYKPRALVEYFDALSALDADMLIVFVDQDGRFAGVADPIAFRRAFENPDSGSELLKAIETPDTDMLRRRIGFTDKCLTSTASNAEALAEMEAAKTANMVVVDDEGKTAGVVRREELMARLLITLAAPR